MNEKIILNENEKKEIIKNVNETKINLINQYYKCIENKNIVLNETLNKDLFFNVLKTYNKTIKEINKIYDLNIKLIDLYNINFITL